MIRGRNRAGDWDETPSEERLPLLRKRGSGCRPHPPTSGLQLGFDQGTAEACEVSAAYAQLVRAGQVAFGSGHLERWTEAHGGLADVELKVGALQGRGTDDRALHKRLRVRGRNRGRTRNRRRCRERQDSPHRYFQRDREKQLSVRVAVGLGSESTAQRFDWLEEDAAFLLWLSC